MKSYPRIRKTVKWGGAVVTVLLVVVWIKSGLLLIHWDTPTTMLMSVEMGRVQFGPMPRSLSHTRPGWHQYPLSPLTLRMGLEWMDDASGRHYLIPLWIPAALSLLCTSSAWALDIRSSRQQRNARLGLCPKCNYDRTGLAAGAVCPECGAAKTSS